MYYHNPKPEIFSRHISYLKKRYNIIRIDDLAKAIYGDCWTILPPNPMVITFDDGHAKNFALLDICIKNGTRPAVYLCSQVVCTSRGFWFQHVPSATREYIKHLPMKDRKEVLLEKYGFDFSREQIKREALSLEEIKTMCEQFDFCSHTRFHEILTTCDDVLCKEEILLSKKELEQMLQQSCRHFSYPNGDYTAREVEMVKQAGYLTARTIDLGWNGRNTDVFELKAIAIQDNASSLVLAGQLTGIPQYLTRLLITGNIFGRHRTVKTNTI